MIFTLLPSVPVWVDGNNYIFDRKFFDGLKRYCDLWPGSINCIMRQAVDDTPDFGLVIIEKTKLAFDLTLVSSCSEIMQSHLAESDIVLASGDNPELLHISRLCSKMNIYCIYMIENTLRTRLQIISINASSPLRQLKQSVKAILHEIKRKKAFSKATGLQANGAPSYAKYSLPNRDDIIYYDNRVHADEVITSSQLEAKIKYLENGEPIRLAFSGRLLKIKGADDLLQVAEILIRKNVDFILSIYGSGELETHMAHQIKERNLHENVFLKGSVDFYATLLPDLKSKTDLFVCLHRQGDPSCTYIESLSCGLPIVGYDNAAFTGILSNHKVGWSAPIDNTMRIAEIIESLDKNRSDIATKAHSSLQFAKNNDFEKTFKKRIDHLIRHCQPVARKKTSRDGLL